MTSTEEFNCIFCKETFDNKDELQIHFRKHGDPKFNESIKTKSRVQNEASFANEKSNDASEMVNCDVCDEVFPTISKAITHKHKVHPEHDAKYFCPWCGKLFTLKHLYNKHLHTNHDTTEAVLENKDTQFPCDSCNVYFFIPSAMVYHNKYFHREDSDLPIIGHSKKQKLIVQDLLPVYYCSFCGEEFINKVNLHKHMCDDHGDENQRPTDVLRCPLCEAIFYHLDAYELHLTFHSSEDLYSETNEMNEKEMLEFSLETVPPVMERIEDLNNLPDSETDVNTVGIESFLQMNMDETNHSNQLPEKARKKHKKHKKSKKHAITLDEFLSMNQDVFGEDLDFQGIEEVPTKVITKQLKIRKPPISKSASKAVSSADLQKLKKLGIAVKVQSGNKPASTQVKPTRQTIKINPQVKNLAIPTKTNPISASNEVLSKLLNQSSSQLKIVKKSAQEKEPGNEPHVSESITESLTDKTEKVSEDIVLNNDKKDDNGDDNKSNSTQVHVPLSPTNNQDSAFKETVKTITHSNDEKVNKQPSIVNTNVNNEACTKQINTSNINQNVSVSAEKCMSDTLKNFGKHITIKPISQPASRIEEVTSHKLALPERNDADVKLDQIYKNDESDNEKHEAHDKSKAIDSLKNLNSAITIKSLKTSSATGPNKNNTTNNDKADKMFKTGSLHNLESSPIQQSKLETNVEHVNTDDKLKTDSPSQVLKNISKNITIKSMSPQIQHTKVAVTNDQHDDSNSDNDDNDYVSMAKQNSKSVASLVPERFTNLSSSHKLNSNVKTTSTAQPPSVSKKAVVNVKKNFTEKETCAKDNTNIESSNNLLKHLTNITAKPVTTSKSISQEIKSQSNNNLLNVTKEGNNIQKTNQRKDFNQDIEIFNIDDSEDEEEQPERPTLDVAQVKKEPINAEVNPHKVVNAIKNISKNIIVKPNIQTTLTKRVETDENDSEQFSDGDEMHDDGDYDSNDDFEYPTAAATNKATPTQQDSKKDSFNNVLRHLGKHITVKSRNASPNQSVKSLNHTSQSFNQETTANDADSDEDFYPGKVKITELTEEDDIDHTSKCFNEGIVTQSPEDSFSGDEQFKEDVKGTDDHSQRLNQNVKNCNENLLKNISKNITVKSVSDKTSDTESNKPVLLENEPIGNQTQFSKELSIRTFKQNNVTNDSEKTRTSNVPNNKRMDGTTTSNPSSPSVPPKLANPGVVNTVNKEVKVKTFQSETVIEEITTTVTKTIRRVNHTVTNQQVFNASQTSTAPRMIKPQTGPRMAGIHNNLKGVTVRQAPPAAMRPKFRQAVPFRPVPSTAVRPSNQLVPIRPGVTPIRHSNPPRMQIKNMPRQPKPVGKPLKISPNVVNQTLKRPVNEDPPGHFSCFKKPKESLIPGNETTSELKSNIQFAASSQMKFCSTTQTVKGNSIVTSTQMKSESLSQQQMNKLGNISGLKVTKASHITRVEKTETNTSNRTTLAAIEKLQKQGLLIKKPRIEDFDPPNSDEDNEHFNDEYDE